MNRYPRSWRTVPVMKKMHIRPCSICNGYGILKIEESTTQRVWWWANNVCSEECFNLWLLQQI